MPVNQEAWRAARKGSKAICAYDLQILNRTPQTVGFDVNEATLEYYELDKANYRRFNKLSPIVWKKSSEGEYLFTQVTDEGAARFRRRNAKLQKDGSLNPYRRQDADESDDETADDDESGAQTTGDGSTSRDDSNAPSEQADAAEPMDVDPTAFANSSATAREATSSTPMASTSAAPLQTSFNPFGDGDSGSDLSSIEDTESLDDTRSSPVKPSLPLPSAQAKPRTKKRTASSSPAHRRRSGAQSTSAPAAGSVRSASGRQRSPSYSSSSEESTSEDDRRPKAKGSGVTSDAEDFKPDAAAPVKKVRLKVSATDAKAAAPPREAERVDKSSKSSDKARSRSSGPVKGKSKARSREEPEAGPSSQAKPAKPPRVNREIKSTARPTGPPPTKEGPRPPNAPSSLKISKTLGSSTAEGASSGSTRSKVVVKTLGSEAASDETSSLQKETPLSKMKMSEVSTPSTSGETSTPAKRSKIAASTHGAAIEDAHRPSKKSKLSTSVSVASDATDLATGSLNPAAVESPSSSLSTSVKRSRVSSPAPAANESSAPVSQPDGDSAPEKKSRPSLSSAASFTAATEATSLDAASPASTDPSKAAGKQTNDTTSSSEASAPTASSVTSAPLVVGPDLSMASLPKMASSGKATPSAKPSLSSKPSPAASTSPASAAQVKRKPETLLKKAVTGGSSGPSTPMTSKTPRPGPTSTGAGSKDFVAELLGGTIEPSASTPSQARSASSIRVQLSTKEQADLEQMRKEHEAEMSEFLALPGMSRPLDLEHQGHVIRARQNAMRRDFDKHDDAANAYEKALLKFRHSGGSQGYEPSRPHPGNPPPAWTRQIPTFPHETGSLCGRLISCMLDRRESSEDGRLAFPRNKAEAANGDFVWVPEMEGKWDDAETVKAYLADPAGFPPPV